jgi:hypothetical protein
MFIISQTHHEHLRLVRRMLLLDFYLLMYLLWGKNAAFRFFQGTIFTIYLYIPYGCCGPTLICQGCLQFIVLVPRGDVCSTCAAIKPAWGHQIFVLYFFFCPAFHFGTSLLSFLTRSSGSTWPGQIELSCY